MILNDNFIIITLKKKRCQKSIMIFVQMSKNMCQNLKPTF